MRKKVIAASIVVVLAALGTPAIADSTTQQEQTEEADYNLFEIMIQTQAEQTLLQEQQAAFLAAQQRAERMQDRIESLEKHVGNTWYVFSGITPDGWDCSGMVMWFYSDFGVELKHSVTAQMHSGEIVDEPMPGDVIAFKYKGADRGYHNGIYIGNDQFIHSPKPGQLTKISSVSKYIGDHSKAVYTRLDVGVLE